MAWCQMPDRVKKSLSLDFEQRDGFMSYTIPFWYKEERVLRSPVFGVVMNSLHIGLYLCPRGQEDTLNGGVFGSYAHSGTVTKICHLWSIVT